MAVVNSNAQQTYTESDWTDFAHTGPGTLAGRYLRLFWHPVHRTEDLAPGRAKPIRVMSEDLTLYRGASGNPHLVAFRCAHRGTQLSTGWVERDNLRCFYHGWMYDASGQCVEQPAEPEPFCSKIRIMSYPVVEYAGLIFAYLGNEPTPPSPRYQQFEQDGFFETETSVIPCNYFNCIENDAVHNAFAHSRGAPMPIPIISAEETDWGLAEHARAPSGEVKTKQWGMPNKVHLLETVDEAKTQFKHVIHWHVPIDDGHTLNLSQALVPLTGEAARAYKERWVDKATRKDVAGLVADVLDGRVQLQRLYDERPQLSFNSLEHGICHMGQGTVADRANECLGATDISIMRYREIWSRELRALAEGRPLKQWAHTAAIDPTEGDMRKRVTRASEDFAARLHWTAAVAAGEAVPLARES